jgi:hypothetical protein
VGEPHERVDDVGGEVVQHVDGLIAQQQIGLDLPFQAAEVLLALCPRFLRNDLSL